MDDKRVPLLGGGEGLPMCSLSSSLQEFQSALGTAAQGTSTDGRERPEDGRENPEDGDTTDLDDLSSQITAEKQDAAVKPKFFSSARFPFWLKKTPAAAAAKKPEDGDTSDLDDRSSQIAVVKPRFFPSARFPFSLRKNPAEAAAAARGNSKTPLHGDCAGLIERLEDLGRRSGDSSILSDPTARLIEATRSLATIDVVDPKARREAQFELLLASTSLTMVASREKLEEGIAATAKKLASEACALLAKAGGLEQNERSKERSNDHLFCITITGALALLPYLPTQIPDSLQLIVGGVFGLVFCTASVGATLSFKATHMSDLKFAGILDTVSFGGFSLLVLAFI